MVVIKLNIVEAKEKLEALRWNFPNPLQAAGTASTSIRPPIVVNHILKRLKTNQLYTRMTDNMRRKKIENFEIGKTR